jgi:hypothetical protein
LVRPVELSEGESLTMLALADLERSHPERVRPRPLRDAPGWRYQEIHASGSLGDRGISEASLVKILICLEREHLVDAGDLTRGTAIGWRLSSESRRLFFAPDVAEEISVGGEPEGGRDDEHRTDEPARPKLMNW